MTRGIIRAFSLPNNLFIAALLETVIVIILILCLGYVIGKLDELLISVLSKLLGKTPAYIIRNYLTIAGTVHHELSHALMAVLTGAKVTNINIFPKGKTLGSVSITARGNAFIRSVQGSLSAIAPVLFGITSLYLMWVYLMPFLNRPWHYAVFLYVFISIFIHMGLSKEDYKVFFKASMPSAAVLYAVFFISGLIGFIA